MGINRNIVECKEICETVLQGTGSVLIETLWNVKCESLYLFVFGLVPY